MKENADKLQLDGKTNATESLQSNMKKDFLKTKIQLTQANIMGGNDN